MPEGEFCKVLRGSSGVPPQILQGRSLVLQSLKYCMEAPEALHVSVCLPKKEVKAVTGPGGQGPIAAAHSAKG